VYDKLEDCLEDHLTLLKKAGYSDAWPYRDNPAEFAKRISDDVGFKYATAPNYASTMSSMIQQVETIVAKENL
jgi:flagellar protein FlgJ